jgi:glutathione S-transferase
LSLRRIIESRTRSTATPRGERQAGAAKAFSKWMNGAALAARIVMPPLSPGSDIMKLYYAPAACSLSPHIVLRESGLPFELVRVSTKTHKMADGGDFYAVNAKGYVPVLELDGGERLTEGQAIVQYLADQAPDKQLAPPNGSFARVRLQEWLSFINSELHRNFGPLFNPAWPDEAKALARAALESRFAWTNGQLEGKTFLMGDTFSVADAYLFTVCSWGKFVALDIQQWPQLAAFYARVAARPSVQAALEAEGLLNK